GRVVPLLVEVGHLTADPGDAVVQHAVAEVVGPVENDLRRIAPRLVPVGAHGRKVAAADAAGGNHHSLAAGGKLGPVLHRFALDADHAAAFDHQTVDLGFAKDFEVGAPGMGVQRLNQPFDDLPAGPPGDVPAGNRVSRLVD